MYGYGYKYTASGSIGSNVNPLPTSVAFTVGGLAAEQTDYVVRLHLHKGATAGEPQTGDVFLNGLPSDDFSDVAFYAGETKLDHYLHSHANFELLFGNLAYVNYQHGNRIWGGRIPISGGGLGYSDDNGLTWTKLLDQANTSSLLFVSSDGYVFYHLDNKVYRSNLTYTEWTEVLDVNTAGVPATAAFVLPSAFVEDSAGNLYCGRYQNANNVCIYKSTDQGGTWAQVYAQTAQQHVHGMYVDTKQSPEAIYAILDGSTPKIIKSVNAGVDWTETGALPGASPYIQMCSTTNYRFFGGEGFGVYRSADDVSWTGVHFERASVAGLIEKDGVIYATIDSYRNGYRRIIMSSDEGDTWKTIWIDNYLADQNLNDFFQSLKTFTISDDTYIACDNRVVLSTKFPAGKIYDRVANKFQALAYLKIPTLPTTGIEITAKKEAATSVQLFTPIALLNLIARYKCDETGVNNLLDSSGNNYHSADGTGSFSRNAYGVRSYGSLLPTINASDKSLKLGDGAASRFIITGSGAISEMNTGKNLTIVMWIKAIDNAATGYHHIFAKGASIGTYFGVYTNANKQVFFRYSNGTATVDRDASISLSNNKARMIAFTISNDATPVFKSYTDGIGSQTGNLNYSPVLDVSDWSVGGRLGASIGLHSKGDISDIQYYNRVLTDLEIRQLYEGRLAQATEPVISQ